MLIVNITIFILLQAREFEDPPGLLEKTEFLLREWVTAYHDRNAGKDSRQASSEPMMKAMIF